MGGVLHEAAPLAMESQKPICDPRTFVKYVLGSDYNRVSGNRRILIIVDSGVYATVKSRRQGEAVSALTGEIFLAEDGTVIGGNLGIGAPAAVAFMEELHACGFDEFILLGSAGTLVDGIGIGNVVLCTKALCDEGTSQHYTAQNTQMTGYPDQHYLQSTREMLKRKGIAFKEAVAWTTDAPYRETGEKLSRYLTQGAQVVEMEASALFNAARFLGVKLSAIFVIGDSLVDGVWQPHFLDAAIAEAGCDLAERLLVFEPAIVQDAQHFVNRRENNE